jgi:serine/threonine protein kinase/uncharacterized protein YecT (DUF1311 family)
VPMSAADVDFPSDLRSLEREYELIRELGQGGMAAVYLARHRATGRLVAIKAIRARYLDDADAIKRFAREARTVAGLDHPNIIKTEAIRQIDDRAVAIIMEHAPGGTVRDRLREFGSLGAEDAESILRDVASALGYAHQHGIVHRDVKPENIFLDPTRRRALLSDFGIARSIDPESGITLLGAALGTPQYMSPEQIDGQMVDGRSDIYSLGVLGWELLTGRRPWAGESLYGVIYKQKHEDLPRITALRPRVPANLLFAIEGALVKDKARRWQTIDEFLNQLTYNPPPLLSQTYPPGAARRDYEPTVHFRSATLQPDAAESMEPSAQVVEAPPALDPLMNFALTPTDLAAVERGAAMPAARPNEASLAPSFPGGEYTLPEFDPTAVPPYDPSPRNRRVAQAIGLLVPLGVAGASLFVLLSGTTNQSTHRTSMEVSSSTGTLASDSAPASRTVLATPARPVVRDSFQVPTSPDIRVADTGTMSARSSATTTDPPARRTSSGAGRGAGAAKPASPGAGGVSQLSHAESVRVAAEAGLPGDSNNLLATRTDASSMSRDSTEPIEDPFKIPSSGAEIPKALGKGEVPSPRCRLASSADQQACLAAYIAVGDIPLNRAFDSLIGEMRRVAGTPAGAPDPTTVQRIRFEHRVWLSVRDNECPRTAPAGAGPFWAELQSACFSEMASARADELRDAVKRLRRRH